MKTSWWYKGSKCFLGVLILTLVFGAKVFAQTAGSDILPVVTIRATTPLATATNRPGVFTVFRTGDTNAALDVRYQVAMNVVYESYPQATNGVDYATISGLVTIPTGAVSNSILIQPFANPPTNVVKTVVMELSTPTAALGYAIAAPESAVVFLTDRTNFPPTVSISSPLENQAYTAPANIPIFADVHDLYGSVQTVEFFAGTNSLGISTDSQVVWTNAPTGQFVLSAVATADNGITATSAPVNITVRVSPPPSNQPPTASIFFPFNGEPFWTPMSIDLEATAFDPDGTVASIASVEFFAGTNSLGFAKPFFHAVPAVGFPYPISMGYSLTWSPPQPGDYELTAVATDDGGATTTSAPVNITVLAGPPPANLPPVVEMTLPTNSETFTTPTNVYFSAFAYDFDGQITNVEFFAGAKDLGKATIPGLLPGSPAPWVLAWTNPPAGDYALTAVATDNGGASSTSAPVDITVEAGPPPPIPAVTIQATDPIAGPPGNVGTFTVFRHGNTNLNLNVFYQIGGTASNGVDYAQIGNWVLIPAGVTSNSITIKPIIVLSSNVIKTVVLQLAPSPLMIPINYQIGYPNKGVVFIRGSGVTNLPPLVNIISPSEGAVFYTPTNINIFAQARDLDGPVTKVEFFAGTNDLGAGHLLVLDPPGVNGCVGPVYFLSWNNPLPDAYRLTAVATDNDGASTTSDPVDITVLKGPPTNLPPTIRIISPANGTVFRAPMNIPIYAYASDRDGLVTSVEFFAGTNSLGLGHRLAVPAIVCPDCPPFPDFGIVWSNPPAGIYALTAEAMDNEGATTVSAPVNLTILQPLPPPTNRPPIVSIVATDPVAVEGTNSWTWPGETNATPTWAAWPTTACRYFTNFGPKTATFAVRRWGSTNADLTVPYDIGGTASNGVDFIALPGSVTVPAGVRHALITIVPIDDDPPDVNKTVILELAPSTNQPPDYFVGCPRRAGAVIIDSGCPRPGIGMLPGRYFHFTEPGPDAAWFCIEYSTNLVNWTPVCTNQVVNGSIDFVDPDAASSPSRFYRAVPLMGVPSD